MKSLYPNSTVCQDDMSCSGNFACDVEENNCQSYQCRSDGLCPEGTTYQPFIPIPSADPTGHHSSTGDAGYMCCPVEICKEPTFE